MRLTENGLPTFCIYQKFVYFLHTRHRDRRVLGEMIHHRYVITAAWLQRRRRHAHSEYINKKNWMRARKKKKILIIFSVVIEKKVVFGQLMCFMFKYLRYTSRINFFFPLVKSFLYFSHRFFSLIFLFFSRLTEMLWAWQRLCFKHAWIKMKYLGFSSNSFVSFYLVVVSKRTENSKSLDGTHFYTWCIVCVRNFIYLISFIQIQCIHFDRKLLNHKKFYSLFSAAFPFSCTIFV